MIVEKATELGAGRLQPVLTRRSQVTRVNAERLAAHAREAAEQCERLDLPAMVEAISLEKLLADWPAGRQLLFCQERSHAPAQIGRASWRERVCPYVWISVGDVSLK